MSNILPMGFQIGENIRKIRELRNYTQDYMAGELGISQKMYSNIERDKAKVDKEQLNTISKLLNIDPVRLLTFDEKFIFNSEHCKQVGVFQGTTYHESSTVERELYEKRIDELKTLYKEQITQLKQEIEFLKGLVQK